jgi:cell division protein FtsZ
MVQLIRQYDRQEKPAEPLIIKVVGVGGAGSNMLDRVMLDGIDAAELVAINTDVQSLTASVAAHKIQLGRTLTRGLGSGGDPELGIAAAEEATEEIRSAVRGGAVVFVCVGLGGGTGSGAAPIVAQLAKEDNALVLVFAAVPFSFEGRRRCAQAEESLARLRGHADAVICFENDRMAEIALPRMGIHEAFVAADMTISQSIRSIAHLLQSPGLLHIGFDDVCKVLQRGDARGLFGFGEAEGENRAHDSLAKALKNPLMNRGELLEEAHHALVHIRGGVNVTLGEVQIIMEELNRHINDQTQLFMGIGIDPRMGNSVSVAILSSLGEGKTKVTPRAAEKKQASFDSVPPAFTAPPTAVIPLPDKPRDPPKENVNSAVAEPERSEAAAISSLVRPPSKTSPQPGKQEPKLLLPVKKPEAKQETLQFEPASRGRFEKSEPTIVDGQDLDVPTFLRKNVKFK